MTSLASTVPDPGADGLRREAAEDDGVGQTQPGARQHREHGLGDHRQVDRDPVAGGQSHRRQGVRRLADLTLQVGVGDRPGVAGFALPVDRHPLAVAGLDVAVDAVVGDVELPVGEPFGVRGVGPVQDLGERGGPGQPAGLLGPEGIRVGGGPRIRLFAEVGLSGELGAGREGPVLGQQVVQRVGLAGYLGARCLGHGRSLSTTVSVQRCAGWSVLEQPGALVSCQPNRGHRQTAMWSANVGPTSSSGGRARQGKASEPMSAPGQRPVGSGAVADSLESNGERWDADGLGGPRVLGHVVVPDS